MNDTYLKKINLTLPFTQLTLSLSPQSPIQFGSLVQPNPASFSSLSKKKRVTVSRAQFEIPRTTFFFHFFLYRWQRKRQ